MQKKTSRCEYRSFFYSLGNSRLLKFITILVSQKNLCLRTRKMRRKRSRFKIYGKRVLACLVGIKLIKRRNTIIRFFGLMSHNGKRSSILKPYTVGGKGCPMIVFAYSHPEEHEERLVSTRVFCL